MICIHYNGIRTTVSRETRERHRDRIYRGLGYGTVAAGNSPSDSRDYVDDSCEEAASK
jgi:hypothetical protein